MSKIKVKYKINEKSFEVLGIKNKNKLIFKEDDISFNITIKNDEIIIDRENSEYRLKLVLSKNSECIYEFIGHGIMKLDIETDKLIIKENKITATYKLNDELFNLEINYEVI